MTLLVSTRRRPRAARHDRVVRLGAERRRLDPGEPDPATTRSCSSTTTPTGSSALYDYVLYTGDLGAAAAGLAEPGEARRRPAIPQHVSDGLLVNWLGAPTTPTSRAATRASPTTTRSTSARSAWPRRSRTGTATGRGPTAGGSRADDTAVGVRARVLGRERPARSATRRRRHDVHPLDGNAFAILAGLATPRAGAVGARVRRPHDEAAATATRSPTRTAGAARTGTTATYRASTRSSRTSRCSRATRSARTPRRSS